MMLLDFLFPNRCLECNTIISKEEIVCEICMDKINFTHWIFGENNDLKERCKLLFPIENAYALIQFEKEGLGRKIIHQLKYRGNEKTGKILANWMIEKLNMNENTPDLMMTVPLHPKKLKERGYNQLHWFADTLAQHFQIHVSHTLIKRNFYQKAQALKDKTNRAKTENLFSVTEHISGKHVLIIDDVFTTGSTISSIAWEILKNPENKISVLVMAVDS